MEIKEVVSYFLNSDSNILEVSFRTIEDTEDVLRSDNIDYSITTDYGFQLESETFDFFDEEFEVEESTEGKVELDVEELITFLNEYYTINGHLIPTPEYY